MRKGVSFISRYRRERTGLRTSKTGFLRKFWVLVRVSDGCQEQRDMCQRWRRCCIYGCVGLKKDVESCLGQRQSTSRKLQRKSPCLVLVVFVEERWKKKKARGGSMSDETQGWWRKSCSLIRRRKRRGRVTVVGGTIINGSRRTKREVGFQLMFSLGLYLLSWSKKTKEATGSKSFLSRNRRKV